MLAIRYELHIWNDDDDFYDHANTLAQAMRLASDLVNEGYSVEVKDCETDAVIYRS